MAWSTNFFTGIAFCAFISAWNSSRKSLVSVPGGGKLYNRHFRSLELHAKAPRVGVKTGFCSAIHWRERKGYEGQPGGDVHDERFAASLQERQKRLDHLDGATERNVDLFGHVRKRILCIDIQVAHDSSVVDQYVAGWKVGSNPLLKRSDVVRVRSVALEGMHTLPPQRARSCGGETNARGALRRQHASKSA
jgi:hypothetical protein